MRPRDHRRRIQRPLLLLQRPSGQPQPNRRPIRPLHEIERVPQQHPQLIHMRRLERGQPIRRHPDQRRIDRLMLPPSGAKVSPRRRGHQQKPSILVTSIQQRIQPAIDERIIHRPHRQNPRPGHPRRQPRRPQQQKQDSARRSPTRYAAPSATSPTAEPKPAWNPETRHSGYAGRKSLAGSPKAPDWWKPSHPATSS